jgi:hypothetical protein
MGGGCNVESSSLEAGYCESQSEHCCFELHFDRFKERSSRRREGQIMWCKINRDDVQNTSRIEGMAVYLRKRCSSYGVVAQEGLHTGQSCNLVSSSEAAYESQTMPRQNKSRLR